MSYVFKVYGVKDGQIRIAMSVSEVIEFFETNYCGDGEKIKDVHAFIDHIAKEITEIECEEGPLIFEPLIKICEGLINSGWRYEFISYPDD